MTIEDIKTLKELGYTAEEIVNFNGVIDKPQPAVEPAPAPAPAPQEQAQTALDATLAKLNESITKMQAANIQQSQQPPQGESVDDILASIIAPPSK